MSAAERRRGEEKEKTHVVVALLLVHLRPAHHSHTLSAQQYLATKEREDSLDLQLPHRPHPMPQGQAWVPAARDNLVRYIRKLCERAWRWIGRCGWWSRRGSLSGRRGSEFSGGQRSGLCGGLLRALEAFAQECSGHSSVFSESSGGV